MKPKEPAEGSGTELKNQTGTPVRKGSASNKAKLLTLPLGKADPRHEVAREAIRFGSRAYSSNIFYYWFTYMKAYPAYADLFGVIRSEKAQKVKSDFDIRPKESFISWWNRRSEFLFYDLYEYEACVREINEQDILENIGSGVNLHIPFNCNPREMLKEISNIFHDRKKDHNDDDLSLKRKYSLHQSRYTIYSIRNKLVIYREVAARLGDLNDKKIRLYDIFYEISQRIMMQRSVRSVSPDEASRRMGENFEQACRLLYNAGEGRFPDFSKPKRHYNPRSPKT